LDETVKPCIQDRLRSAITIARWYDAIVIGGILMIAIIVIMDPRSIEIDVNSIYGIIVAGSSSLIALSLAVLVLYRNSIIMESNSKINQVYKYLDLEMQTLSMGITELNLDQELKRLVNEYEEHTKEVLISSYRVYNYFHWAYILLSTCIISSLCLMVLKSIIPISFHIYLIWIEIIQLYLALRLIELVFRLT